MSNLRFSVNGESNSTTQFVANARHFKLVVDEPEDFGGTDAAANPVEYILAGLAGCINVVGHLVAKELGFVISKLNINISGEIKKIDLTKTIITNVYAKLSKEKLNFFSLILKFE